MQATAGVLLLIAVGCGRGSLGQGGERQPCFPNGTCNAGLTCASNTCVDLGGGGMGGAAGTAGAAGASGTSGASGTTGAAGASGTSGGAGTTGAAGVSGTGGGAGAGGAGGTAGRGGVSGQGGGISCGAVERPSFNVAPDILLLQDASGSMNEDSTNTSCGNMGCGGNSKWALMTAAIEQVVSQTETQVNWGLKLFADVGNACGVANSVAVGVAPMNSAAIAAAIVGRTDAAGNVTNGSSTPTRAAENAAVTYLSTLTDPNPKFIVLATDGQPNCPMSGNQQNDDTPAAVAAVTAARTAGFPTFVVGISAGGAPELALNSMAVEGGYPQVGQATQYYPVSSTAQFAQVLRSLVTMANTCTFSVPPPPTNDGTTTRANISVKATDTAAGAIANVPQDATNGWTYTDATMTSIVLHGLACNLWKDGTYSAITIVFHCLTV